jgi:hypothetical protein
MPTTQQEKEAKAPVRIEKQRSSVITCRRTPIFNSRGRTIGFDEHSEGILGRLHESEAAAIYAIAKTQE